MLKLFLGDFGREELFFYELLGRRGLRTLPLIHKDQDAFLMEDLNASQRLTLATEEAARDPVCMAALGSWYRELHLLTFQDEEDIPLSEEWQVMCPAALKQAGRPHQDGEAWRRLYPLLEALIERAARLPLRLCYNDFHPVNLVLGRQEPLAFMMDYGRMGLNYPGCDLVNALWFSDDAARAAFRGAYGLTWPEEEAWSDLLPPLQDFLLGRDGGECGLFSDEYFLKLARFIGKA